MIVTVDGQQGENKHPPGFLSGHLQEQVFDSGAFSPLITFSEPAVENEEPGNLEIATSFTQDLIGIDDEILIEGIYVNLITSHKGNIWDQLSGIVTGQNGPSSFKLTTDELRNSAPYINAMKTLVGEIFNQSEFFKQLPTNIANDYTLSKAKNLYEMAIVDRDRSELSPAQKMSIPEPLKLNCFRHITYTIESLFYLRNQALPLTKLDGDVGKIYDLIWQYAKLPRSKKKKVAQATHKALSFAGGEGPQSLVSEVGKTFDQSLLVSPSVNSAISFLADTSATDTARSVSFPQEYSPIAVGHPEAWNRSKNITHVQISDSAQRRLDDSSVKDNTASIPGLPSTLVSEVKYSAWSTIHGSSKLEMQDSAKNLEDLNPKAKPWLLGYTALASPNKRSNEPVDAQVTTVKEAIPNDSQFIASRDKTTEKDTEILPSTASAGISHITKLGLKDGLSASIWASPVSETQSSHVRARKTLTSITDATQQAIINAPDFQLATGNQPVIFGSQRNIQDPSYSAARFQRCSYLPLRINVQPAPEPHAVPVTATLRDLNPEGSFHDHVDSREAEMAPLVSLVPLVPLVPLVRDSPPGAEDAGFTGPRRTQIIFIIIVVVILLVPAST